MKLARLNGHSMGYTDEFLIKLQDKVKLLPISGSSYLEKGKQSEIDNFGRIRKAQT